MKKIGELVKEAEKNYNSGSTQISDYVSFNLKENINKIDAYLNSKHTSGETDSQGREKPFFNIVTAAVNIWYRATDIDRKNIKIKATKGKDFVLSFLSTLHLQDFMKRTAFGIFLNDWGLCLARYGSAVIKIVEQGGELRCNVIPWNRLICDPIDFDANPKIEKLYFTPAQLKRKNYDKEKVNSLIESLGTRKSLGGQERDNRIDYIEVYEVHGEMPLSYLTGNDDDDDTYQQQMHVISFVENREKGTPDDFTLYSGRESKDPYMITHLIKEDGRSQSIGAVEHLLDAQWMMNHTVKSIKDQLDLASKIITQTSDATFTGRNVLTAIEQGDILVHKDGHPLTRVDTRADIVALQSFATQWKSLGNEITGVSEAMMGQTQPSGTAWRQVQALLQESHSLFEIMTESKGLYLEEMLRKYIIPSLKKKMDTTKEISNTLDSHQINQIDSMYVPSEAVRRYNKKVVETILNTPLGETPEFGDQQTELQMGEMQVKKEISPWGNQRFIKPSDIPTQTWKEVLKDLEWEVEVDITGEQKDKMAVLDTWNTVLQFLAAKQGQPLTPDEKMIFNKILEETSALSPIELNMTPAVPPVMAGGSVVGEEKGQSVQFRNPVATR